MKKLIKKFIFLNVIIVIFSIELFSQSLGNFKEFNKGELYFVPPVDSELVNKLGNYLIETGFFDGYPKSVQLLDEGIGYVIKFIVPDSLLTERQYISQVKSFTAELSENVFSNQVVDIHLASDRFVTKEIIKYLRLGNKMMFGKDELYYLPDMTEENADKFVNFLKTKQFFNGDGKTVQISMVEDVFKMYYPVQDGFDKDEEYLAVVLDFANQISEEYLGGGYVMIYLTDIYFYPLRAVANF